MEIETPPPPPEIAGHSSETVALPWYLIFPRDRQVSTAFPQKGKMEKTNRKQRENLWPRLAMDFWLIQLLTIGFESS